MAVISYVHFFAEVAPRLHQVNAHAMWLTDTTFCSHQIDGAKTSRLQWCAIEDHQDSFYVVNWHFLCYSDER